MSNRTNGDSIRLSSRLLHLLALVVGVAATYFMTIQSLKTELAAKAESAAVSTLDSRLASLEVLLREGTVGKAEFYGFSRDIENRLIRIEAHLTGEASGQ